MQQEDFMRTAGTIAVVALAVWVAFKLVFGVAGGIIGLLLGLAWFALKLLIIVGVGYFILKIVSPETARRVRERVGGTETL
jgi:hypothetical protein